MRRPGLFLALDDELNIRFDRNLVGPQCVERGHEKHDINFVVAGSTGVDAPLGTEWLALNRKRNNLPAIFKCSVAQRGLKRRACPFLGIERLASVIRTEHSGL